jgi:hypothetical protein
VAVAATVASAARIVVRFAGIEWIEGTADISATIMAPQGDINETVTLSVPRTNVATGSGPLTVPASGPIPSVLLSQAGQAKVVAGPVVIHLATLTASRTLSVLGNLSLSCSLNPGQNGVVTRMQIHPIAASARPGSATTVTPRPDPTQLPTQTLTPTHAPDPTETPTPPPPRAPNPSPSPQIVSAKLLRRSEPFARSFPGFVLLALFLLGAAMLVIVEIALRTFKIGLEGVRRGHGRPGLLAHWPVTRRELSFCLGSPVEEDELGADAAAKAYHHGERARGGGRRPRPGAQRRARRAMK